MTGLDNIKLLSFICAYKAARRNSIVYSWDKMYKLADELRMSCVTLKRLLRLSEERGYLVEYGQHRVFKNLAVITNDLFPSKANKHLKFFKHKEKKADFKYYQEIIKYAFAERNFLQQEYNISKNDKLKSKLNRNISRKIYQAALEQFGVKSFDKLIQSLSKCKENIVTGKFAMGKLLKCSPSTASKLLRTWHDQGKYERIVEKEFIRTFVCHESFEALKSLGYKTIWPVQGGFLLPLGSVILLDKPCVVKGINDK